MKISAQDFKEAYQAAFISNRRHLLWNTKLRRTAHMTAYIYRTIADSFPGIEIEYEHRDIDAVLYAQSGTPDDIIVAMEHENNVQSISTELKNLCALNCPLSVIVTYTGLRNEYLQRHLAAMERFSDGTLLFVINAESWNADTHKRGKSIPWEFLLWSGGELVAI